MPQRIMETGVGAGKAPPCVVRDRRRTAGSLAVLRSTTRIGKIPNMGTRVLKSGRKAESNVPTGKAPASGLASQLFTKTRQRLLGLLFGYPNRTFRLSELIDLTGAGTGAVQREVARLAASGLVSVLTRDGRKVYKANEHSPIFSEICSIVEKTTGVADQLRRALAPLSKDVALAILFGSIAKETDRADSDVDLLVVTDALVFGDVFQTLVPVQERIGRRINPILYTTAEFDARRRSHNPFMTKVLSGKHRVLLGELHDQGARKSGQDARARA